ncbi:outer membrane beta-barrel protein [Vibrio echinoideorum]|uniref:outer membrane beta-barrel protein n=1 Tax=Vibrio echinoideorum TaxID=2100116 RepID=UPI00354F9A12
MNKFKYLTPLLLFFPSFSQASFLVGASIGEQYVDSNNKHIKEKDKISYSGTIGYEFSKYFAIYGELASLGSISIPNQNHYDIKSIGAAVSPQLPLGNIWFFEDNTVYAKLGYHKWDMDINQTKHIYDEDIYWSVGWRSILVGSLYSDLEFSEYKIEKKDYSSLDLSIRELSFGLTYKF